jgi:hypothetical protein
MKDYKKRSLFRNPSFFKGAARTVALFGGLDEYKVSGSSSNADVEAIKQDWQTVGQDLVTASKTYGKNRTK